MQYSVLLLNALPLKDAPNEGIFSNASSIPTLPHVYETYEGRTIKSIRN